MNTEITEAVNYTIRHEIRRSVNQVLARNGTHWHRCVRITEVNRT